MASAAEMRFRKRLRVLSGIGVSLFLLVVAAYELIPDWVDAELATTDRLVKFVARDKQSDEYVFVGIDEQSLVLDLFPEDIEASPTLTAIAESPWPQWPRSVYADAAERLLDAGARCVILDLVFDAPKKGDERLAEVIRESGGRVIVGSNLDVASADGVTGLGRMTMPSTTVVDEDLADEVVGYVSFIPGPDDVVRRLSYRATVSELTGRKAMAGEKVHHSLAATVLRQIGEADQIPSQSEPKYFGYLAEGSIPEIPFYTLFIQYDWETIYRNGEMFRDKIVMIGPSAPRLQDFHPTPLGRLNGPLLHLNAIEAAKAGRFFSDPPWQVRIGFALAAAAGAVCVVAFVRNPIVALLAICGAAVGYIAIGYGIASVFHILVPVLLPSTTLVMVGVAGLGWNFASERRESGRLRATLDRYVSRNVVREILDNREDFLASLGGTRRPMTVLFSDVRGFTSLSESSDATQVVAQLNDYLGEMVRIIFRHDGTVDKFLGDGILAVWGNVVSHGDSNDARSAVSAALEMHHQLSNLNANWIPQGLPEFRIGIGLHHGEAVFGNIGSHEKMEPTVIGDAVNLTSRVEGLTKQYGVAICVTQSVATLVSNAFHLQSVDRIRVVGRSEPVDVFAVLARADEPAPTWLERWESAVQLYRTRNFAEAVAEFSAMESVVPNDKLCRILLERANRYTASPPPADWDGSESASSK